MPAHTLPGGASKLLCGGEPPCDHPAEEEPRPEAVKFRVSDQSARKSHLGCGYMGYESPLNQKKGDCIVFKKAVICSQECFPGWMCQARRTQDS